MQSCAVCGKELTRGYHFACHVCGATFCYSHAPEKCLHRKAERTVIQTAASAESESA